MQIGLTKIQGKYQDDIYDIELGPKMEECTILCNGKDITKNVRRLIVTIEAGHLTLVRLETIVPP